MPRAPKQKSLIRSVINFFKNLFTTTTSNPPTESKMSAEEPTVTSLPSLTKTWHNASYAAISPSRPELSTAAKTVFITGGGSGLGPRIAHAYAVSGSTKMALLGRTASTLTSTKISIESAHKNVTVLTFVADVTDPAAVNSAFEKAEEKLGKIDVLVSNAGYLPKPQLMAGGDVEEWWKGMEINVKGNFIVSQAFLKVASSSPTIIVISTAAIHIPPMPSMSGYAVTKLAGHRFFEYLAAENPHVKLMLMHPGVLDTNMGARGREGGAVLPWDDLELPASFAVWMTSPEAEFLKGKMVWANWDVEELKARKAEFEGTLNLTLWLQGWP